MADAKRESERLRSEMAVREQVWEVALAEAGQDAAPELGILTKEVEFLRSQLADGRTTAETQLKE